MTTTTTGGGLPVGVSVEDTKCLNRPLGAIKNPLQSLTIVIFLLIIMIIISSSSCCQRLFCYQGNSEKETLHVKIALDKILNPKPQS